MRLIDYIPGIFLFVSLIGISLVATYDTNSNEIHKDNPDAIVEGACVVHVLDGEVGIVAENNNEPFRDRLGVRFGSMDSWRYYHRNELRRCNEQEQF